MKDTLKKAYKETPERFRYAVGAAVNEAQHSAPQKRRLPKGAKIAIAIALIAVLLPGAVFGATQIIRLHAEKTGNYGVKLSVTADSDADSPAFVKMHVNIPEGFAEVPNTAGMKFYNLSTAEPYTDGFSLAVFRPTGGDFEIADYADGYEETVIAGHLAYKIIPVENYNGFDRVYVCFEDVNVVLLVYYKDVTDAQLESFIAGITFSEGGVGDIPLDPPADQKAEEDLLYVPEDFIPKPLDTEIRYSSVDENGMLTGDVTLSAQVSGVRVLDSISGLDTAGFNELYPMDEIADANSNILPHTRQVVKYGDGIDAVDEIISSKTVKQKLVLIDFRYTNLESSEKKINIPWRLSAMQKDAAGKFSHSEIVDKDKRVYADPYCSTEIVYLDPHGSNQKEFYSPVVGADDSLTVTVGFLADADKLDELYLMCCPSSDGVLSDYPTENPYTYYVMKVQ